ncbi:ArsR/SmtB family transcription factor [Allostreptomyces psammosilenae]|uniref:DNA-binding transcriptional ArsR family regulator n=1 Tax=Allostreptomyces psammosilenae TaxID=1892865 RepID=A0A853AAI8_9ACTN|nr:helix-turn-helix domain-containing protein [Allostreptomyces psammosilenae]NYI07528.1 DNA-binding transcriptional ArsR family regulator [Allostreptomyces psammosilenae]
MGEHFRQPAPEEIDLPTVLGALADPVRLATVRAIDAAGELTCGQVHEEIGEPCGKSTMSHHLRILREAGLTGTRIDGARRLVSLRRDDLDARFPGLLGAVLARPVPGPARAADAAGATATTRGAGAREAGDAGENGQEPPRQRPLATRA